jgi:hypothetical protein
MSLICSRKIMYHGISFGTTIFKTTAVAWLKISQVVFSLCGIKILCVPPPAKISTLPLVESVQQ